MLTDSASAPFPVSAVVWQRDVDLEMEAGLLGMGFTPITDDYLDVCRERDDIEADLDEAASHIKALEARLKAALRIVDAAEKWKATSMAPPIIPSHRALWDAMSEHAAAARGEDWRAKKGTGPHEAGEKGKEGENGEIGVCRICNAQSVLPMPHGLCPDCNSDGLWTLDEPEPKCGTCGKPTSPISYGECLKCVNKRARIARLRAEVKIGDVVEGEIKRADGSMLVCSALYAVIETCPAKGVKVTWGWMAWADITRHWPAKQEAAPSPASELREAEVNADGQTFNEWVDLREAYIELGKAQERVQKAGTAEEQKAAKAYRLESYRTLKALRAKGAN